MFPNLVALALAVASSAAVPPQPATTIHVSSPAFRQLVPAGAKVQVIAEGITWSEGPVWVREGGYLLFSDVPKNRMYRWTPGDKNASVFLEPSGPADTKGLREPGSNGIKAGGPGHVLFAGSGDRALVLLDLATKAKHVLVDRYQGKRLNSPNDIAVGPDGSIWFTDPPYGLEGFQDSPLKEQAADRVYRLTPDGKLIAEISDLKFPNGIAFSLDGRTLYVSNSDSDNAVILAWDVSPTGQLSHRRIFADMNALVAKDLPGLPDGMCVDEHGNLWASGPGGIHVLTPQGREIGLISRDDGPISNCAFGGPDGRTIFMTSNHEVLALHTSVRGAPVRVPKLGKLTR